MSDAINRKRMNIYIDQQRDFRLLFPEIIVKLFTSAFPLVVFQFFFSVTRSMPPLGNVSLVKSRSVLLLRSVEILNIMEREEGKTTWRRVNR